MGSAGHQRRRLLQWLAASPLLAAAGGWRAARDLLGGKVAAAEAELTWPTIETAADAVNVFDFERAAQERLTDAHWTYLSLGVDDEATLLANRTAFQQFRLRSRRLVDVSSIDMSTEILGTRLRSPIMLQPAGAHKAFHSDGELAVARGARASDHQLVLSTVATQGIEDVAAARGAPVWFQLYPTDEWPVTAGLLRRAEAAGCPVVELTVDLPASNRERMARFQRDTNPDCRACHMPGFAATARKLPMFDGLDITLVGSVGNPAMDWEFVKRLQDSTTMQVVIKGVTTAEDAALCVDHGVAGIVVSNHGGRAQESGRGAIECLPEVVAAVDGRLPIIADSGFRRGTDILKALALGADAVGVGRPYLWGLAAFGQSGVEGVMRILDRELEIAMKQAGTPNLAAVTPQTVERI